jgi:hypothetical protein
MAGGYFTGVVVLSSQNYRQESATELRRLTKDVAAACGAVILRIQGVSFL